MRILGSTLTLSLLVVMLLGASLYMGYQTFIAQGSVIQGGEYNTVQITAADAGSTSTIRTFYGSIGQVTVASSSGGADVIFYDTKVTNQPEGTTTSATTTTIFTLDGTIAEGTYTFDASYGQGLLMEVQAGFNGDFIINYR